MSLVARRRIAAILAAALASPFRKLLSLLALRSCMSPHSDLESLMRLHALVVEALTLADGHHLDAAGIALDSARLAVERAIEDERPSRHD